MEIKRSIRSNLSIQILLTTVICFLLGFILLVSLDNYEYVPIQDYIYSIFTVYTQFGFIIFSVIAINTFNIDYREKNIMFYKRLGFNSFKYFLCKLFTILFWFSLGTCLLLLIVSLIYNNFMYLLPSLSYFLCVLIYIISLSSLFGFLFRNILVAFCFNIFVWIASMFLSTVNNKLSFLTYFDAANPVHKNYAKYLETGNLYYLSHKLNWLFSLLILIIISILILIFKKRWDKNGV